MAGCEQEDGLSLGVFVQMMKDETDKTTVQTALQTIHKLLRNIQQNPSVEKYRTIRKENPAFAKKVWSLDGAQQFLLALGYVDAEDCIILPDDSAVTNGLSQIEEALKEYASVQNGASNSTVSQSQSKQLSDKEKKLLDERQRQLQQMKREQEERQRIKEKIKADRANVNTRELKDSQARQIKFGSNMKSFKDIGVDLNKGGG